ncbi:glycosyltransferase family 2 protein [Mollicutes bacterium LVI A0039]|nr:glycosyltransferase family 2 protein [Mollicutes bacterium LVI A0039]
MTNTLIIIPAYNEQDVIIKTMEQIIAFTDKHDFDYVVIDDGSKDKTRELLQQHQINYISHSTNLGIGEPFKTGIEYGLEKGYTKFINFDADGQHSLDSLHTLVEYGDYDYVVGSRYIEAKKPFTVRTFGSRVLSLAIKFKTGRTIADPTSGLLLINNLEFAKYYISQASNRPEPSIYPKIVKKFKVKEVQVQMENRVGGSSYFNPYNSIHFMLEQLFLIVLKG